MKADAVAEIQNGLALEATLTAIKGAGWTTETLAAIDALIDAIKAKTDNLPAVPAPANEYDVRLAAIQADLDNPSQYKADVSGIPEAVMTAIVEGAVTLRDSLKIANALLAGKTSGGGSGTVIFRDLADTLNRVIAVVDANNNRTTITRDLS